MVVHKKITMKLSDVLDYVFPRKCLGCGREEGYLCSLCREKIQLLEIQCCPRCRRAQKEGLFCSKKCAENFNFDQLIVCLEYSKSNLISKMVVQFKYRFSEDLVEILGKIMKHQLAVFSHNFKDGLGNILLIPVPLSAERIRFRGFNQSLLLAKYLAKNFSRMTVHDCMGREGGSEQQAGRSRKERLKNLENKIFLKDGCEKLLQEKSVIVIDDIATTGTTLNECARILKTAGVSHVCGLVLARGK
jgi:ComF family protein